MTKATQSKFQILTTDVLQYSIYIGNGTDAEKVARLGIYGNAAQDALTAYATTYDAFTGRMSIGT